MANEKLIEQLSDLEHESWSRWMNHLFNISKTQEDGSVLIPKEYVARQKQINAAKRQANVEAAQAQMKANSPTPKTVTTKKPSQPKAPEQTQQVKQKTSPKGQNNAPAPTIDPKRKALLRNAAVLGGTGLAGAGLGAAMSGGNNQQQQYY